MARPPVPHWLMQVPKGIYTLDELVQLTGGKTKESLCRIFKRLNTKKIRSTKVIYKNILQVKYKWNPTDYMYLFNKEGSENER